MVTRFDEFVREMYVQAGMNPRCAACHGVPGYSVPCLSSGKRVQTSILTRVLVFMALLSRFLSESSDR